MYMSLRYHKMIWKWYQKNSNDRSYASGGGENIVSNGER